MSKPNWFDRAFEFDLPVWMARHVLERLRGTPARVEELARTVEPAARTRHLGESWSIQEHVGHLFDLESLWFGRIDDILGGLDVMRPADLSNRTTQEARHDEAALEELLARFREARAAFVTRLDAVAEADFGKAAKHPRLEQPMRLIDLMFFVAEHDDHHLADVSRLQREFASS